MVHIIYKDGKAVGWKMVPTTDEEQKIAATVRDLQFFGLGDTGIEYGGIALKDDAKGKTLGNLKHVK